MLFKIILIACRQWTRNQITTWSGLIVFDHEYVYPLSIDTSEQEVTNTNYDTHLVVANVQYIQQMSLDGRRARTVVCTHAVRAVAIDYHFRFSDMHAFS